MGRPDHYPDLFVASGRRASLRRGRAGPVDAHDFRHVGFQAAIVLRLHQARREAHRHGRWCGAARRRRECQGVGRRNHVGCRAESPFRAHQSGSLPWIMPGDANDGDRVWAGCARNRGRQFIRIRPLHRQPGHRPDARPTRYHGQGRDHAPGIVSLQPTARHNCPQGLCKRFRRGTAPPSFRVQQQLPPTFQ